MQILVTGSSGFIGTPTVEALIDRGHSVVCLSRKEPPGRTRTSWRAIDLLDPLQRQSLFDELRPQGMMHLAWETEHGRYWQAASNLQWASATQDLVWRFWSAGGERLVIAGTCAEYEWKRDLAGPLHERTTLLRPASLYGTSKASTYHLLSSFSQRHGLSMAWARLFFVYGPGEPPSRFIPSVINSLLDERHANMTLGEQQRDFIYVEDAAAALAAIFDSPLTGPINVGSGTSTTLRDVATKIGNTLQRGELVRFGSLKTDPLDVPIVVASIERLSKEVGFVPRYPIDEGLSRTIRWWQDRRALFI